MIFHIYNVFSNVFSISAYLFSSFINSSAAKYGLSYLQIGLINFLGALSYVTGSLSLGHIGDKYGHKKILSFLTAFFAVFGVVSYFLISPKYLYFLTIGVNFFFGSFYPQIEAIISKGEKRLGIDHAKIIVRFNLSWSSGNIIGMAFGPFLTVKAPYIVFLYGLILTMFASYYFNQEFSKIGDSLQFKPRSFLKQTSSKHKVKDINLYRRTYRLTLFFSGMLYTSFLALFPKLISSHGLPLNLTGFIVVGANISVFLTFLSTAFYKEWIYNPKLAFGLMSVLPITSILLLFPKSSGLFFVISILGGMCYAVPYTLAIFYGLESEENDQGKQGGFHEATIGMLFGFGPLVGGIFMNLFKSEIGLSVMGFFLSIIVLIIQTSFLKKLRKA